MAAKKQKPYLSDRAFSRWSNVQAAAGTTRTILRFSEPLIENSIVPVTGEDGLAASRIVLALVEAGKSHQVITF
jgi:hypothetical protein